MEDNQLDMDRIKELTKKKKDLMKKIRTNKKAQIRARLEKKKINSELRQLKGKKNLFTGMTPSEASKFVKSKLDSVKPSDIFPKTLEREFDRIERPRNGAEGYKVVDLGNIPERPLQHPNRHKDLDEDTGVIGIGTPADGETSDTIEEDGVIDLSES
jgi:hypothetical protein